MELPFLGMDPWLETPALWKDLHSRLIVALSEQPAAILSERYFAAIDTYIVVEVIEPDEIRRQRREQLPATDTPVALAPAPLVGVLPFPATQSRIELRTADPSQQLVTVIEVLLPANKRPSQPNNDYERRRQELLATDVTLLEIDLLRAGNRPAVAIELPPEPYFVLLSRATNRPYVEIWPLPLRQPIPLLPVLLLPPDPDVPLDIGAALRHSYRTGRFAAQINYDSAPPAPPLAPDDLAWLHSTRATRTTRTESGIPD